MSCKICQQENKKIFSARVLNKYEVSYFYCSHCGLIAPEEPYWLGEAYASPINISDTGLVKRNLALAVLTLNVVYYFFNRRKTFLDYAGGYGLLVRLLRDSGLDFKWQDIFSENLLARGFEYAESDSAIELVTAFEVFEHFSDPLVEIEKMLKISKNILFSTTLLPSPTPAPADWWYYGFKHGQHVSFYSQTTLQFIAKKYGLNYYTTGGTIHLFTPKKINRFWFRLLTSRRTSLFAWLFARPHFKSKTWADYLLMTEK